VRPHVAVGGAFRRALGLAFRDPVQSWLVPLLLLLPWSMLESMIPDPREVELTMGMLGLFAVGALGGLVTTLIVSANLRVRMVAALSGTRPRALESYARALERTPALLLTEVVRSVAVSAALLFFVIPGIVLGQRLSVATESVVLDEPSLAASFQSSFALTHKRFGSWLRMFLATALALGVVLLASSLAYTVLLLVGLDLSPSLVAAPFGALLLGVVQYAWTCYYVELGGKTDPRLLTHRAPAPSPAA
jgi:hypothetical protein